MTAVVGSSHILCAIGSGTEQVWAAARAGIARIASSNVLDRHADPIPMGLVPEDALAELVPDIEKLPLPARARRILRLAAPSFQVVAKDLGREATLYLGLPQFGDEDTRWVRHVPAYLQMLAGVPINRSRSVVIPQGRAAGLVALERALQHLDADPTADVIVGAVDSYFDEQLLTALDAEERLLRRDVMDGFIPGEGAAFYQLSAVNPKAAPTAPLALVQAAASTMDPGHRYGDAPARGEGLATLIGDVRGRMPALAPIATTFAGFNGENFDAKLWGVARLRHNDFFTPGMLIEHPADKFGDAGAAIGAILIALAARSLAGGTRPGPALVWAASDRELRACAIVSLSNGSV